MDINLDDLSSDQAMTLRRLLDEVNFFTLPENPPTRPVPDGFQYTITVETETAKHTVRTSDTSASAELHSLLQELSHMARSRRRS